MMLAMVLTSVLAAGAELPIAAPAVDCTVYDVVGPANSLDFEFSADPDAELVWVRANDATGVVTVTVQAQLAPRPTEARRVVLERPDAATAPRTDCGFDVAQLRPLNGVVFFGTFYLAFEVMWW